MNIRKKLLLIVNPKSGTMQGARHLSEIIELYSNAGYMCTVLTTSKSGDARDFAYEYAKDYDITVCAGGDGTLNEVVNGVIASDTACPIGYIPVGSTNDFATSIGIPRSVMGAAERVISGTPKKYDIGSFSGRCFSYVASFGAFTSTSYSVPQNLKNILGHNAYILQGIKDVLNIQSIHADIVCEPGTSQEEKLSGDYIFGGACNSTILGGVLKLKASDVDMNDGLMELILVERPRNIIELNQTAIALLDKSLRAPNIKFRKVHRVEISIEEGTHWTIDGEYEEGQSSVTIEMQNSAIELIV